MFVSDASVTLAWCFADEASPSSDALLDRVSGGEEIAVPPHWSLEVLNGALQAQRRGRVTEIAVQEFLANLFSFRILVDMPVGFSRFNVIRSLAFEHQLTAYDAAYLELAMRLKVPIATRDEELKRAASNKNVPLL